MNLTEGTYGFQNIKNYIINLHQNKILEESCNFFDRELYLGAPISEVDRNICEFFLCNRCSFYSSYIQKIKNLKKYINKKSNLTSNSRFKIIKNSAKCHFSNLRNC